MSLRKIAIAAAALGMCVGSAWAQEVPSAEDRIPLPGENDPGGRERLGTNSFGGRPVELRGIHNETLPVPDLDLLDRLQLPKRYYLTIRYYAVNPWFINPYSGAKLEPHEIVGSVQTNNPDWAGLGKPLKDLLNTPADPTNPNGDKLVEISGYMDDKGNEMVIDEDNQAACDEWTADQEAEDENVKEAQTALSEAGSNVLIPKITPQSIIHAPFYGLYCLKIRICIPIVVTRPQLVYNYWVRWPYRRFQPWCWSRWWWWRPWRLATGAIVVRPWRPICVPRAVWTRIGPNWVWHVTNPSTYRRWCLFGLRYYFIPFRQVPLPTIAGLNSVLNPQTIGLKWRFVWPYPRRFYWPFRPYCTRWYWFRCLPWTTYRYFPPIIKAAFAIPKLKNGAGFVDGPNPPDPEDPVVNPTFPIDPPDIGTNGMFLVSDQAPKAFSENYDVDALCVERPLEEPVGDQDGNGFVSRSDVPRPVLLERLEAQNPDTADTDGSVK